MGLMKWTIMLKVDFQITSKLQNLKAQYKNRKTSSETVVSDAVLKVMSTYLIAHAKVETWIFTFSGNHANFDTILNDLKSPTN